MNRKALSSKHILSRPHLDAGEDLVCELADERMVHEMLVRGEFAQSLMTAPLWKCFAVR